MDERIVERIAVVHRRIDKKGFAINKFNPSRRVAERGQPPVEEVGAGVRSR
jgi:hypothetical protein